MDDVMYQKRILSRTQGWEESLQPLNLIRGTVSSKVECVDIGLIFLGLSLIFKML